MYYGEEYVENCPVEWQNYAHEFHYNIDPARSATLKSTKEKVEPKQKSDHDLTMEFLAEEQKRNKIHNLCINEYEKVDNHIVYKIEMHVEECNWVVSRRYREFHRLHEELVNTFGVAWELLPPKKIVGNLSLGHIEKRKTLLQKYLTTVLQILTEIPQVLTEFLEIDQFNVNAVCHQLACDLYEIGDDLLRRGLIFKITPLQIHCINRRLQLPLPTCEGGNKKEDIGHLYSFIQQVTKILIHPGDESHMFVVHNDLNYDLSIFKSLKYLEVNRCDIELMEGIESIQQNVTEIHAHKSLQLLKDFLIGSGSWTQGVLMTVNAGKESHNEVVNQFQIWNNLKKVSFSYNDLHSIDYSITLLPKIEVLDLSHNLLTEVQYLEELMFLSNLDLSYNEIRYLGEFHYRLPSVSKLSLAGNGLQTIAGLGKMYALQELNIANNNLTKIGDVLILGNLPMLEVLHVKGNALTEYTNHRVRIFMQFGYRAAEVTLDGTYPSKREMVKILELVASQESYDIINEDVCQPKQQTILKKTASKNNTTKNETNVTATKNKELAVSSSKSPSRSPRIKKKDRVACISSPADKNQSDNNLSELENANENFREQIGKLREHAGDSWLTFYNEMSSDKDSLPVSNETEEEKLTAVDDLKKENIDVKGVVEGEKKTVKVEKETKKKNVEKEIKKEGDTEPVKPFIRLLSMEEIDLELSDEMRMDVKEFITSEVDLNNETFLIIHKDGSGAVEERIVTIDTDANSLIILDFNNGSIKQTYKLESVCGLTVDEEKNHYILQFETKAQSADENYILVKLRTQASKDAAGLYTVLKSYSRNEKNRSQSFTGTGPTASLIENPFNIPNEILISFFQEFIRKTNLHKKSTIKNVANVASDVPTNYENIDIGVSFLRHDVSDTSTQDIVSILWLGCLPYLFPDEEIPVCLVMTTINIFLFRIFLPENDSESKTLQTMAGVQEAMHCFYSFPLKGLREIVVGLFDQGLRIEVADEGPRGTFVFLTRDASKTAQFLDGISSVLGFNTEKEFVNTSIQLSSMERTATSMLPSIIYPDENKIHALKVQLQEQNQSPLDNRENLISYCIVYERRDDDYSDYLYDETSLPYLRSLILTNLRLILCDEDYVHWPLPSYVRSAPFTPQWIVDDVQTVDSLIGVDMWEDMRGKQSMTGCYGVTITFEATETSELEMSLNNVWNLLFQSILEREQFVRSIACLWKNNFDQDLKITYSKTAFLKPSGKRSSSSFTKDHAKKPSGNISIPATQSLDTPEMFINLDRSRLNELFRNKISTGDDHTVTGVQYVTCVGCKAYNYPDIEFNVALILGKFNLYLISSAENRKYILANTRFEDEGGIHSLYITTIKISDLQQVVVGLFDQCFRLEADSPSQTFVFVTRNFDHTNEFVQRLSQTILALSKQQFQVIDDNSITSQRSSAEIFQLYKREDEANYYPKSEFIHPNSNIKIVYPSDETLEKLRYKILDHIQIMDLFTQTDDFGILLYSLICQYTNNLAVPYTIVVSERFLCLINEDHVNYPLPLFVKELPERTQYEVVDVQLISSLLRIEFDDFNSGSFSLVFNKSAVDPASYDARFQTDSVDEDVCLVTDLNNHDPDEEVHIWQLEAHSYIEREKVFNILSKMWSNFFSGKTVPVFRSNKTK